MPEYNYLIKKTNFRIKFHKGLFSKKLFLLSKKIKSGQILLLENIRFNKLEELNDVVFAQNNITVLLSKNCLGKLINSTGQFYTTFWFGQLFHN